jgi:hypothetical protein
MGVRSTGCGYDTKSARKLAADRYLASLRVFGAAVLLSLPVFLIRTRGIGFVDAWRKSRIADSNVTGNGRRSAPSLPPGHPEWRNYQGMPFDPSRISGLFLGSLEAVRY